MAAGRGVSIRAGVHVGPVGRLLVAILNHYPRRQELSITSGFRPGPRSHHRGLVYRSQPTAALDVISSRGAAGMRDVAKWLYDTCAADTVELIHSTPFATDRGFYVKNQRRFPGGGVYPPATRRQHRDHVHFATSKALAAKILKSLEQRPAPRAAAAPAPRASLSATRVSRAGKAAAGRRLSDRGARLIEEFEGLRQKLYNDPAGHCTIGIGHLVHRGRCNGGEPAEFKRGISRQRAYALLKQDARRMEAAVNGLGVPLNQNQFDALVSFTYNLGPGWTQENNGIRRALLARRYRDVPREMMKWVKAGGRTMPGLVRRRRAEGRLFASGAAPGPAPKPPGAIKLADVQPGKNNGSVLVVQKALKQAVGLDYASGPGIFGPRTRKAYAAWQKKCGAAASGTPDLPSLKKLGDRYEFKVQGSAAPPSRERVKSPVPGYKVTTPYGKRGNWQAGYHTGDDYAAPAGKPVVAVRDGVIQWSKAGNPSYGNWIGQRADNGRVYVYCHLKSRAVKAGQRVKAGTVLGHVGQTGNATGPHLHFEDHPPGDFEYGEDRKPRW